jgi:hypothetical protein
MLSCACVQYVLGKQSCSTIHSVASACNAAAEKRVLRVRVLPAEVQLHVQVQGQVQVQVHANVQGTA